MSNTTTGKIGIIGVISFIVCGMIGFDGLAASAAVGSTIFGWWVIIILIFLIPNLLMVSELATSFPADGAVYDWAHKALGPRSGARVGWYYWINVPFWMPAVYLIAAGIAAELFWPDMPVWVMSGLSIGMVWITVFICNTSVEVSMIVNIVGGISKVIVLLALIVGGIHYLSVNNSAVNLTLDSMLPRFDSGFKYAPTLVYLFVGAETIACMGSDVRNPARNIPVGLAIALLFIIILYSLAIGAMMVAIPADQLSLVGGIAESFEILFQHSRNGKLISLLLSLITIVALITYIVPWLMAASRAAAEGADAGEMPAILRVRNASGSPSGANLMTGIIATVALVINGFLSGSASDLFWSLFAFASVLLFMTYLFLLASYVVLRRTHPDFPRPFRLPGGMPIVWLIVLPQGFVLLMSCAVFIFPDLMSGRIDLSASAPTLLGIAASVLFVEYSIRRRIPTDGPAISSSP